MTLRLKYFAWVRERIGRAEDEIVLPAAVETVADLVRHLKSLGEEYAYAFEDEGVVRAAIDRRHVAPGTNVRKAREVAFFPPMTGG